MSAEEYVRVENTDELIKALKDKAIHILLEGEFKDEFLQNTDLPLSEEELMPFELGFRGVAGLVSEGFYKAITLFSNEEDQQKFIDSKVRR
ncbi:MAG TPA: hypothetical protein VK121_01825, partial [Pseudogracilibacillus sp.]|nr:hypothetical protein [Pseudogracilibacillus sp.]